MERRTSALIAFAIVAVAGYAVLRVASWAGGEPDPRVVFASAHTGYYWRVVTAVWWGVLASAAAWRFPLPVGAVRAIPIVVALATAAAIAVP